MPLQTYYFPARAVLVKSIKQLLKYLLRVFKGTAILERKTIYIYSIKYFIY